jgi:DNA polymerase V
MIALVDCNNFFASCERLFRPDLKDKPVLVLSNNDGCVVARSNEVKALDIPMGVPYFKIRDVVAKNKVHCFSSNFSLYSNMSQRILGVLERYTPQIEIYSIDEAFMQLNQLQIKDYKAWGNQLREQIQYDIGMPVSVGIAPTKTLAKLASAYAKKHQQTCYLDPEKDRAQYEQVLSETKVGAVWGVGRRLAPRFERVGIHNALQLAKTSEKWLHSQIGIGGSKMHQELNGTQAHAFEEEKAPQKSLLASRSFGHTVKNIHELESAVASFASNAAFRLRLHEQSCAVFGVYLRYRNPEGKTEGISAATHLTTSTNDTGELVGAALELMRQLYDPAHGYKKAGVFAYNLSSANICQVDLFDKMPLAERGRRQQFLAAIDQVNERYGSQTIQIGSIDPKSQRWHAKKERMSPAYTTDWSQLPLLHSVK